MRLNCASGFRISNERGGNTLTPSATPDNLQGGQEGRHRAKGLDRGWRSVRLVVQGVLYRGGA